MPFYRCLLYYTCLYSLINALLASATHSCLFWHLTWCCTPSRWTNRPPSTQSRRWWCVESCTLPSSTSVFFKWTSNPTSRAASVKQEVIHCKTPSAQQVQHRRQSRGLGSIAPVPSYGPVIVGDETGSHQEGIWCRYRPNHQNLSLPVWVSCWRQWKELILGCNPASHR